MVMVDVKKIVRCFWGIFKNVHFSDILSSFLTSNVEKDKKYFIANKILAKHDENYMPPEVAEAMGQTHEKLDYNQEQKTGGY